MQKRIKTCRRQRAAVFLFALLLPAHVAAAEIIIVPVAGFNDPTYRAPVDGNPGDTVGDQRRNAINYVADLLGSRIESPVPIRVRVSFNALDCKGGTVSLAVGGPTTSLAYTRSDRPNAKFEPNVFYPIALANALAKRDLLPPGADGPSADISAQFNGHIDTATCLSGRDWYYGYDGDPPGDDFNFIATALHELIHGLGFISGVDLQTGQFPNGMANIYDALIKDFYFGQRWPTLAPYQLEQSITHTKSVVWDGNRSTQGARTLLSGATQGKIRLYAPDPVERGSSISHLSDTIYPNDLMEPFVTGDISLSDGIGLATCVLADIGWQLSARSECPDRVPAQPADIFVTPTVLRFHEAAAGASKQLELTVRNIGGKRLTIKNIKRPAGQVFSIVSGDCAGSTLPPDAACTITIQFSPAAANQSFADKLWISSNDVDTPDVPVYLKGRSTTATTHRYGDSGGSGGGGCTIAGDTNHIGPLLPLLLFAGLLGIGRRRLRASNSGL